LTTGNGAMLKVCAYKIEYLDGSAEEVDADTLHLGVTIITLTKGANAVRLISIHNMKSIEPRYLGQDPA